MPTFQLYKGGEVIEQVRLILLISQTFQISHITHVRLLYTRMRLNNPGYIKHNNRPTRGSPMFLIKALITLNNSHIPLATSPAYIVRGKNITQLEI